MEEGRNKSSSLDTTKYDNEVATDEVEDTMEDATENEKVKLMDAKEDTTHTTTKAGYKQENLLRKVLRKCWTSSIRGCVM
jgi:hypothetical protein